jgi:hypothetical protein
MVCDCQISRDYSHVIYGTSYMGTAYLLTTPPLPFTIDRDITELPYPTKLLSY